MEQQQKKGRAKYLGWGFVDGAYGPVVAISRQLLDGKRLIMKSDADVWFDNYEDYMKRMIETHGCGLRVVQVHELENGEIETVIEPVPDAPPVPVYVDGDERMPAPDQYILATEFVGEFYVGLYLEDVDGNRTFLWGDDYIFK